MGAEVFRLIVSFFRKSLGLADNQPAVVTAWSFGDCEPASALRDELVGTRTELLPVFQVVEILCFHGVFLLILALLVPV